MHYVPAEKKYVSDIMMENGTPLREVIRTDRYDTIFINSACGTGKSYLLRDYVSGYKNHLMVSVRIKQANNMQQRFSSMPVYTEVTKLDHFRDYRGIISVESIWKLSSKIQNSHYDVVVLDEINSICRSLTGATVTGWGRKNNLSMITLVFCEIVRHAKQVICMDDVINVKCMNMIRAIRDGGGTTLFVKNTYKPYLGRVAYHYTDKHIAFTKIMGKLAEGKNIFIASMVKKQMQ